MPNKEKVTRESLIVDGKCFLLMESISQTVVQIEFECSQCDDDEGEEKEAQVEDPEVALL